MGAKVKKELSIKSGFYSKFEFQIKFQKISFKSICGISKIISRIPKLTVDVVLAAECTDAGALGGDGEVGERPLAVHVGVRYAHVRELRSLVQIGVFQGEDMHGALVRGGAEELAVQTEVQTVQRGRIDATPQLDDLRLTQRVEHPDQRALLRGRSYQGAIDVQRNAGQLGLVRIDADRRRGGVRSDGVHVVDHHRTVTMARTDDHLALGRVQRTDFENALTVVAGVQTEQLLALARKRERVYDLLLGDENSAIRLG